MSRCSTSRFILAFTLSVVAISTTTAKAGWLSKATGGRIKTPKPIQKLDPTVNWRIGVPEGQTSGLAVVSPPYIDARTGRVYSGTGRSDSQPRVVGQAKQVRRGNRLYWVSNYRDMYGRPNDKFIRYVQTQPNNGGYNNPSHHTPHQVYKPHSHFPQPPQMTPAQRYAQMRHNIHRREQHNLQNALNKFQREMEMVGRQWQR